MTGKRTRIHCCLELSDNLHFFIARNCMHASGNWTEHLSRASVLLPLSHLASAFVLLQNSSRASDTTERMPCLRHRMRFRRGSSRRQIRRSPTSSSTSAAVSPTSDSTSRATRGRILHSGQSFHPPHSPVCSCPLLCNYCLSRIPSGGDS